MSAAFDQGFNLYKSEPNLMLIEVARRASRDDTDAFRDFVDGYIAARRQREEHDREKVQA